MSQVNDVIEQEPKRIGVLPMDKMPLFKEYKDILVAIKKKYMTAKDIWNLYFDEKTKQYSKGQKTIYRYIHKLVEEGLIIEVGYRESPNSRVNETLYGPFAKVLFYEGPQIVEEWKTEEKKDEIRLMHQLVQKQLNKKISFETFYEFALQYLIDQDAISSELLRHAEDPETVELLQSIPPNQISHLIFLATNLSILAKGADELTE